MILSNCCINCGADTGYHFVCKNVTCNCHEAITNDQREESVADEFSDFFTKATPEEKEKVIRKAVEESSEDMREIMRKAERLSEEPKDWEKEFDKFHTVVAPSIYHPQGDNQPVFYLHAAKRDVKAFIRKAISEAEKRGWRKGYNEGMVAVKCIEGKDMILNKQTKNDQD